MCVCVCVRVCAHSGIIFTADTDEVFDPLGRGCFDTRGEKTPAELGTFGNF